VVLIVLLAGAVLALLDGSEGRLAGWLAYSLLLGAGLGLLLGALRLVQADRGARFAALAAFGLRLAVGVLLALLLPRFGYADNEVHQAGYLFFDAFSRDRAAWELAGSGQPILTAFSTEFVEDQYGGLLALSALIYRYLSPDAHRPMLVALLAASVGALGIPFLWRAAKDWFGSPVALLAAWILALYPDAVLLGSSQMREAFILSGGALALYGVSGLRDGRMPRAFWLAAGAIALLAISPPAAFVMLGLSFGLWLLDPDRRPSRRQTAGFVAILAGGAVLVILLFARLPSLQGVAPWQVLSDWFQNNFEFQTYLLERSSGWVQKLFREAGQSWEGVIVTLYGIAQPVLPAHVVVPGIWLVKLIGILRAAGWYLLAPFLIYGLLAALRPIDEPRRRQLIWLGAWILLGTLGAALVAGGDQWDNPRYRAWLIPWGALLASWGIAWARLHKDAWLTRLLIVESVFILVFTEWYVSRYYRLIPRLNFWLMTAVILALGAGILAYGWWWDRKRRGGSTDPHKTK
jgi:hypothetical protein